MTDYSNGKNVLLRRPEPGRPVHPVIREEPKNINVDTNAIADAVIKAINGKISLGNLVAGVDKVDNFDDSESLKRLADAMSNQEGSNKSSGSNLEGLGKTKEVKKDQKEVDKAIDMLSQLGD
jgi:hypothetical protein